MEENASVWIVEDKDDNCINGIYTTEEKAKAAIASKDSRVRRYYYIREHILDKETE